MCSNLSGFSVAPKDAPNSPIAIPKEGLITVLETKTIFLALLIAVLIDPSIFDQESDSPFNVGF